MNPEVPPSWPFEEVRRWLLNHPEALEPGLKLMDRGVDLGRGLEVPICGVDPLGHPCLVLLYEDPEELALETLVDILARMTAEGQRFQPLFPRPSRPRVFVLTTKVSTRMRERLALLVRKLPIRVLSILEPQPGDASPQLVLESFPDSVQPEEVAADLPEACRGFALRLFLACRALHPEVPILGNRWPYVFLGRRGLAASIFLDGDSLWFAPSSVSRGAVAWKLQDSDSVDRAIDILMRSQTKNVSPAA